MNKKFHNILFILNIFLLFIFVSPSWGTELKIPEVKAAAGQTIRIPIIIDKIDNLAGMKLAIKYDSGILTYKTGNKTSHTDSLMHIVNDKNPGKLIIVMAGAQGIKGENIPVFTITFGINKDLEGNHTTTLSITEVQLMSDKLEDIKCEINVGSFIISPGSSSQPAPKE